MFVFIFKPRKVTPEKVEGHAQFSFLWKRIRTNYVKNNKIAITLRKANLCY